MVVLKLLKTSLHNTYYVNYPIEYTLKTKLLEVNHMAKRVSCNPPIDCFTCKYKDCIAPMDFSRTKEESRYLNMFLNNKSGRKSKTGKVGAND